MKFRGGEFSTRTTGNFQPELTVQLNFVATGSLASSEGYFPIRLWRCTEGFRFERDTSAR
jgi:hypothetical protein